MYSDPDFFFLNTLLATEHKDFHLTGAGLYINIENPFLGASPDGFVECKCHGAGVLEIKCPFKFRNGLDGWKEDKGSPIDVYGNMLKEHKYYYRMQHQMFVTGRTYCDFFVWSNGLKKGDTILLRVERDDNFCKTLLEKLKSVFTEVILPELLCRKKDPKNDIEEKKYCLCQKPSFYPMISCDSPNCKI